MKIPLYLAMTAAEYSRCTEIPPHICWMACHFSSSGPGLSNMPHSLPAGSVLMVDDSIPFSNHRQEAISAQLAAAVKDFQLRAIILDLQRPAAQNTKALSEALQKLPCPIICTPAYAPPSSPVLLPPCPPNRRLQDHIAPFKNREIWLELALEGLSIGIDRQGCHSEPVPYENAAAFPHWDERLLCHYKITRGADCVTFHLQRSREDLQKLLESAERLGITHAVGLWQELK